jgi:hypothetical protein
LSLGGTTENSTYQWHNLRPRRPRLSPLHSRNYLPLLSHRRPWPRFPQAREIFLMKTCLSGKMLTCLPWTIPRSSKHVVDVVIVPCSVTLYFVPESIEFDTLPLRYLPGVPSESQASACPRTNTVTSKPLETYKSRTLKDGT